MNSQFLHGVPLRIFPCKATKAPANPRGFYAATSDPNEISDLWSRWPGPLIGVATGAASGLSVLDVDRLGLPWFCAHRDRLPLTFTVETPSDGLHLWFEHVEGLRCSASRIARGVDVRADGGYAIFWRAHACAVLHDVKPAPWPEWLMKLLKPDPWPPQYEALAEVAMGISKVPTWRERAFAKAAMNNAWREMLACGPGIRNWTLNAKAYSLGRLVARGWIERRFIEVALEHGAGECGLTADDGLNSVRATIASGMNAGLRVPYPDIGDACPQDGRS